MKNEAYEISIPMPLQIVVEDAGWWSGTDGSARGEPFRTAMGRRHLPEDYEALAALGARLGMRPLLPFVLAEWDRRNILRKIPSATWMGEEWDNRGNVGPWLWLAADILRKNACHLEIGLHGVGHEYWQSGRMSRSEFHDAHGVMRPESRVVRHLEAFGEILAENDLGPFPEAFVPPALHHSFGNGASGFQEILSRFGVRFVTTIFHRAKAWSKPLHKRLTWECGVLLLERGASPVPWDSVAAKPAFSFDGPILSLHWANLLHPDPAKNIEVVDRWADFIRPANRSFHRMLSSGTAACRTQFAFRSLARITPREKGFEIDIGQLDSLPAKTIDRSFHVKIRTAGPDPTERTGPPETGRWQIRGGRVVTPGTGPAPAHDAPFIGLKIIPERNSRILYLYPEDPA